MGVEATTKARQKRKADLVYIMGGKCCVCGYDKCQQALEFHHIDKSTKRYNLSNGNCHSWEEDIAEVKKCALVCSNCHKELEVFHYNVFNSFDDEKFFEINEKRKEKERHCLSCGREISRGARYCASCYALLSRKTERPNRETLKEMIRNKSFVEISKEFNVSDNAIRKWCDGYSLPRTKKVINSYSDFEWKKI